MSDLLGINYDKVVDLIRIIRIIPSIFALLYFYFVSSDDYLIGFDDRVE
jgi:hypothetical protein